MALQSGGQIKYSEIEAEFGRPYATSGASYTVPWVKWTPQAAWVKSTDGAPGWYTDDPNSWSTFLRDYGVYPSNTDVLVGSHTGTWRIFFPTDTYTIELQADNSAIIELNGSQILTSSATDAYKTSSFATFSVTENQHYITAIVTNAASGETAWNMNPAGVAWEIKNSAGAVFARSTQGFNYSVASTGWGSLLNTYGVYPSATAPLLDTVHTATYVFEPDNNEFLTYEATADHQAIIKLDGVQIIDVTDAMTAVSQTIFTSQAKHTLEVSVENTTSGTLPTNTWFHNPGGVAFTIKTAAGAIVRSSLNVGTQPALTDVTSGYSFGNYRVSETHGDMTYPLDKKAGALSNTDIPSNGEIKFSNFYNARLNMIVNYFGLDETRPETGSSRYNDVNKVLVVGKFKERPSSTSGKKIHIVVNKNIGSDDTAQTNCALRTGSWDSDTKLTVDVGPSGVVGGAGGDGGVGGSEAQQVGDGKNGSSGLGVEYEGTGNTEINVASGGVITAGYGGGGGGGGAEVRREKMIGRGEKRRGYGGGGGGGAGLPSGEGGAPAGGLDGSGQTGQDGTLTAGGEGGTGSSFGGNPTATGGTGGDGGSNGVAATAGGGGAVTGGERESEWTGPGGAAGGDGAAIRNSGGITITINNSGTVTGSTSASGVT